VGRAIVRWSIGWLIGVVLAAQVRAEDHSFSFSVHGNLTTGSQIFPNPNSNDPVQRAQFFPLEDFFGYGIELKYQFPETNLALGLGGEYIRTTKTQSIGGAVPTEDGYRVIPIEVTAYFLIPVSGPAFGIYMGGGGGVYFGSRIYRIAGVEADAVDQGQGFGIHVLGGVSYRFLERLSMYAEMKFRDLQFSSTNIFNVAQTTYGGIAVPLPQGALKSRVHTDGIVFQLGASVSF
jgi:opacity protein-like surface antigen